MRYSTSRRAGISLTLGLLVLLFGIVQLPSTPGAYSAQGTTQTQPPQPAPRPSGPSLPPKLSILLLIDVTGSMGENNKLEQAKQAAVSAIWNSAPPAGTAPPPPMTGVNPAGAIPHTPPLPPLVVQKFEKYIKALEDLQKALGPDIRQWLTKAESKEMGVIIEKCRRLMQGLAFEQQSELMKRLSPLVEKMHYSIAARVNQELGGGLKYILPGKTPAHPEFGGLFSLKPSDHDAIYMGAKADEAMELHKELAKTYGEDFLKTTETCLESSRYLLDKPAAGLYKEAFQQFSGPTSNLDWMRTPSGSKWIQDYVDKAGKVMDLDTLSDANAIQDSMRKLSSFTEDELKGLGVQIDRRSLKDLGCTLGAQSDFERQLSLGRLRNGLSKGLTSATAEDTAMLMSKYGPRFQEILENSGVDLAQTSFKDYVTSLKDVGQKAGSGQALTQADLDILKKFDDFSGFVRKSSLAYQGTQYAQAVKAAQDADAAGDAARAAQLGGKAREILDDTQAALHNFQQLQGEKFAKDVLEQIKAGNPELADNLAKRLESNPWVVNEGTLEDAVKKQLAAEGGLAAGPVAGGAPSKVVISDSQGLWDYAKANPGHSFAKFAQYGCYGWMAYDILSLIHEGKDAEALKTAGTYAGLEGSNFVAEYMLAGSYGAGAGGWVTLSALGGFMLGNYASHWVQSSQVDEMTLQMLSSYSGDGKRYYDDGGMLKALGATGQTDEEIMAQFKPGLYGDSTLSVDANGNVTIKKRTGERWKERGGEIPIYETTTIYKNQVIAHQRLMEMFQTMRGKYLEAIDRGEISPDDGRMIDEFPYEDRFATSPGSQFSVPNKDGLISLHEYTFYRKLFDETWQQWSLDKNPYWGDSSVWGNNMENAFKAKWSMFRLMIDALSSGKKRDLDFQQKLKDESPENLQALQEMIGKGFVFSLNGKRLNAEDVRKMIEDKQKSRSDILNGIKSGTGSAGLPPDLEKALKEIGLDELLPDLAAGQIEFGMMPYSGGCGDHFSLFPFTQEADSIKAAIVGLSSGGATPMTPALYQARYAVCRYGRGQAGAIILLCDGQNDCSESPVKAAGEIFKRVFKAPTSTTTRGNKRPQGFSLFPVLFGGQDALPQAAGAQGQPAGQSATPRFIPINMNEPLPSGRRNIPISVSTVGFKVTADQQKVLDDIAREGGGISGRAENMAQLTSAFSAAIQQAAQNTGVGGGGAYVLPSTESNGLLIAAVILVLAVLALLAAVIIVRNRRTAGAGAAKVRAKLDVVYADGGRKTFLMTAAKTTIGRAMDNSLVLNDPEVSGYHAEILASAQGFLLRDLKSTNGTLIKGQRIAEQRLFLGDEITIGKTRLTFGS